MRIGRVMGCAWVLSLFPFALWSQDLDNARWWTSTSIAKASYDSSVYPPTFRLYGPQQELRLLFEFTNKDPVRQVIVSSAFFDMIQVSITGANGNEVNVSGEWVVLEQRFLHGDGVQRITRGDLIYLSPGDQIRAEYVAKTEPTAKVLGVGNYVLHIDSDGSEASLRYADLSGTVGPVVKSTERSFSVEAIKDETGMHRYLRLEAQEAYRNRDFRAAINYWRQLRARRDDVSVAAGLGMAYLALGEFRDAALELEKALGSYVGRPSTVPRMLAQAYLALGQESRANEVLRIAMPEESVQAELDRLKNEMKARQK